MSDSRRMLIMPAFNEADHLPSVLRTVHEAAPDLAIVVVDDGSRDDTAAIAASGGATVLRHPVNLGYGAALQTGYKFALRRGASVLVQMDADGQHDPRQIPRLLGPVERGELDLVIGSRFLGAGSYEMSAAKSLGRRLFELVARLFGLRVTDPTSGFQAMNRTVLELYARDFFPSDFPDVDVLLIAHREGLRIGETPVEMSAGLRPSTLHQGLAPLYYVYKMSLSIWAASSRRR
jgi:glycosyltransferase involved in cell wall biosynthesis